MENEKGREMKRKKVRENKVGVKKCKRKMTLLLWNVPKW